MCVCVSLWGVNSTVTKHTDYFVVTNMSQCGAVLWQRQLTRSESIDWNTSFWRNWNNQKKSPKPPGNTLFETLPTSRFQKQDRAKRPHPLSPRIRLGIRPPRKKERKKETARILKLQHTATHCNTLQPPWSASASHRWAGSGPHRREWSDCAQRGRDCVMGSRGFWWLLVRTKGGWGAGAASQSELLNQHTLCWMFASAKVSSWINSICFFTIKRNEVSRFSDSPQ